MAAKDRYAVAVNGSSISMERPSDTVIRTKEGTTVLYSFAYFFIRLP